MPSPMHTVLSAAAAAGLITTAGAADPVPVYLPPGFNGDFDRAMAVNLEALAGADRAFAAGRHRDALDAYLFCVTPTWCTTEYAADRRFRVRRIATCLLHLGEPAAAARVGLHWLRDRWAGADDVGRLVYDLYRDADQLDDLRPMLDALDAAALSRYETERVRVPGRPPLDDAGRRAFLRDTPAGAIRELIRTAAPGGTAGQESVSPHVPKPKPGSLPTELPAAVGPWPGR